jgi:hypothetical protein
MHMHVLHDEKTCLILKINGSHLKHYYLHLMVTSHRWPSKVKMRYQKNSFKIIVQQVTSSKSRLTNEGLKLYECNSQSLEVESCLKIVGQVLNGQIFFDSSDII